MSLKRKSKFLPKLTGEVSSVGTTSATSGASLPKLSKLKNTQYVKSDDSTVHLHISVTRRNLMDILSALHTINNNLNDKEIPTSEYVNSDSMLSRVQNMNVLSQECWTQVQDTAKILGIELDRDEGQEMNEEPNDKS